jgi:hypothetical protein
MARPKEPRPAVALFSMSASVGEKRRAIALENIVFVTRMLSFGEKTIR